MLHLHAIYRSVRLRSSCLSVKLFGQMEYDRWVRQCDTLNDLDRALICAHVARLAYRPLISIVMLSSNVPPWVLRSAIVSVQAQLYPNLELCVAGNPSYFERVAWAPGESPMQDPRIKWMRQGFKGNIAAALNATLMLAGGEFVALMDPGGLLPEHALYEVAVVLNRHPDADLLYADEDQIGLTGRRVRPYFKPDWSFALQLGHNLFNRLGFYRRSLLEKIDGFREGMKDGGHHYDIVLRSLAATNHSQIHHIPAVLYYGRQMTNISSIFQCRTNRRFAGARLAVADYLRGQGADVLPAPAVPEWNRIRWPLPNPPPLVSLILLTRDKPEMLARCVAGLLHRTDYPGLELLIVDNDSRDPEALILLERLQADSRVRLLHIPGPFNYSALNNEAVREAAGEIIVLINNDIDVSDGGWLREMVSLVVRPGVGVVGAKLLFPDNRVQHAGVVLGVGESAVAGHFGYHAHRNDPGYVGQFILARELSAVTGACLAISKELYETIGGLDAKNLPVSYNDVDLCLRIREHGRRVIWTPFAELYHLESASRGYVQTPDRIAETKREIDYMRSRWGCLLDNDRFYNTNFDRLDHSFQLKFPARRQRPWRQQQTFK
jgi:O-antigen biosynthesis protein